jgi:hypothetical protein
MRIERPTGGLTDDVAAIAREPKNVASRKRKPPQEQL